MKKVNRAAWLCAVILVPLAASAQNASTRTKPRLDASTVNRSTYEDIQQTFGQVPSFFRTLPDEALPGAWSAMKSLQLNPSTALSGKHKELISLAVAAQIPCTYCVYFHTKAAKLNGADERELREALALSALTRQFSTVLNGSLQDMTSFRAEIDRMYARNEGTGGAGTTTAVTPPTPMPGLSPADATLRDVRDVFGFVPSFMSQIPKSALPGFWDEWKTVELNESTALPGKVKSLISLAVASQVPCDYCIYADRKGAVAAGASQQEMNEAIAMAAVTRHWSTLMNGSQLDLAQFRKETDQVMKHIEQTTR